MSLVTFSQNAISNRVHCFPDSVAKKIAIDLVRGDSAKAELSKTKQLVLLLEEKNATNQRLITSYVTKVSNYASQIDLYKEKESEYKNIVLGLESDNKKLKKKVRVLGFVVVPSISVAGILLLIK